MTAPKRDKYYTKRKKDGKELSYESPEKLLSAAHAYFKWCDNNPWYKKEAIRSGARAGETIEVPVGRPYTLEGLCVYLGICIKTFHNYESRQSFSPIITHIREIISQHQIEGAITGAYNVNIISRISGIGDKPETGETTLSELVIESDNPETEKNLTIIKERLSKSYHKQQKENNTPE